VHGDVPQSVSRRTGRRSLDAPFEKKRKPRTEFTSKSDEVCSSFLRARRGGLCRHSLSFSFLAIFGHLVVQMRLLVDSPSSSRRRALRHPFLGWYQNVLTLYGGLRKLAASSPACSWRQTEQIDRAKRLQHILVDQSRLLNAMASSS